MRVVHVAPTPFGRDGVLGGGERYPVELARALAAHVDCELVTFGGRAASFREASGLRVRVLPALLRWRGHPAHPLTPAVVDAVAGADIVHTHHMKAAPGRLAALASRIGGRKVCVTDHGLGGGAWLGLLPALFDRFLTVSRYSAECIGADPAKVRVIYGGADPHRYAPDPNDTRSGVLFVGRITPHKGLDVLIRALPDGLPLLIAGSGGHDTDMPQRAYPALLRRLVQGRDVRFLGPVSDDDLPALYRSAQVLVLPSVHRTCYGKPVAISELLGLSVLEAMASGTPVVASRIGGVPEIVADGETGFLVQPGNVEELRERIAQVTTDERLTQRLGARGRELVLDRFTWEACARRCHDAYTELVHSHRMAAR